MDGFLNQESATVTVLNGTNVTGLATKKANELESYGYMVEKIDDAPTDDYLSTVLIDNSDNNNPYTKTYLERRLGIVASDRKPDGLELYTSDFVIIIGANE